jgi:hypothetical protein
LRSNVWGEFHGDSGFDHFSSWDLLVWALDRLQLPLAETAVPDYGCGTGPGACLIAERGYQVDAIDLIPPSLGAPGA